MWLKFKILTLITIAWTRFAQADGGNKIGNGGDVVQCGLNVTLLDFYESSGVNKSKFKDPIVIAREKFETLQKIDSKTGNLLLKRLNTISDEIEFRKDIKLIDIEDSKHLFLPKKNCRLVQIAVRKMLVDQHEKQFLIRKDLWNKLDPINKAGLLSHEIIYEYLYHLGESNSVKARKLNAFLFGKDFSSTEYWKLIKSIDVSIYP